MILSNMCTKLTNCSTFTSGDLCILVEYQLVPFMLLIICALQLLLQGITMLHSIFYLMFSSPGTRAVEREWEGVRMGEGGRRGVALAFCFLDSADLAILCQSCCIKNTQRCTLVAGQRERDREVGSGFVLGRHVGLGPAHRLRPTELQFCTCCE